MIIKLNTKLHTSKPDGGGGHSLVRREPCAGHCGGCGGHHDAGDPVEDGAQVTQQGEVRVGDVGQHEEHAADGGAQRDEGAGEEDGRPEAPVLQVEHRHKEHQEGDGSPVSQERDGALAPGWEDDLDHIDHGPPGVPHTTLEHRQQGEY